MFVMYIFIYIRIVRGRMIFKMFILREERFRGMGG